MKIKRYKMFKNGKAWCIAAIATITLGFGFVSNSIDVSANTVSSVEANDNKSNTQSIASSESNGTINNSNETVESNATTKSSAAAPLSETPSGSEVSTVTDSTMSSNEDSETSSYAPAENGSDAVTTGVDDTTDVIVYKNNPVTTVTDADKNGFAIQDGHTYFYQNGQKLTGQQTYDNSNYYFDVDTFQMKTNYFYSANDKLYYYGNDGKMYQSRYYQNWGATYYFGDDGARFTNQFLTNDGGTSYFGNDGIRYEDRFYSNWGSLYYFGTDGKLFVNKFYSNWGNMYYFGDGGIRYTNKFYSNWGALYYFGSDGALYTNKFYSNWGSMYYFGSDGARYTNQFYQNWGHNYFFGGDGSLQKGFFNDGRTKFLADGNGVIYAAANDDTVALSQRPNLPTGCEIVAITMLLQYAGVNVSKEQIANEIPHSSNPNYGFVGNPYATASAWVLASGIASELSKYLGTSQLMNGASMFDIQTKLNQGHLVAVWMGDMNGFSEHCVTLTGYGADYLQYNNPWTGQKETMSYGTFYSRWGKIWNNALSF
ncbi:C39 family peptidase [Paucilactobacillus nenjiangensis]|nr:C39 family peptidase [Paucilactobacillus nenjiangensis]